ncbi:MAG: 4Fe-4S binding protein [Oscillatoriales cyanobacterium]|nr:MAG: 4Fe-4S binding protein [Oscillatoriales cyanobacterium]
MFARFSERTFHQIRWVLTIGWLLSIASLFYDPFSAVITRWEQTWSPFRVDPSQCVTVQGNCLPEQPYPIGTSLFWGIVVPAGILILLVFGHELWRRICPLSFLSQIPRALGWQRQHTKTDPKTGKVKSELAKVKPNSWLGRNYPYLQFGWLFVGLCLRILVINSDRLALGLWLLGTIAIAIAVGYLYGGKSWCQYFCPMAPVQRIYGEPGGLFASKAHTSETPITQSMCRTVDPEGKERSACVACQNPCIDIDSERSYWDDITDRTTRWLYYGYVGLVVGYFGYYYLYAGNWTYYMSGYWARQTDAIGQWLKPGFYLAGQAIAIPKLLAVPLTLGLFTVLGVAIGLAAERAIRQLWAGSAKLPREVLQHRIFTICTFAVFNFFFLFGGRPIIAQFPTKVQWVWDTAIVLLSAFWLQRAWARSPRLYSLENLANRFRKQLVKMRLDVAQYFEGRSIDDLNPHELYVLAKVLPGFTQNQRQEAYKGVLRESLEEGFTDTASSLEVLRQLRQELDISDHDHREILAQLGVEDPALLDPNRQRSLENLVRLTGYRRALERTMTLQANRGGPRQSALESLAANPEELAALRLEYGMSASDEERAIAQLDRTQAAAQRGDRLIARLTVEVDRFRRLHQPQLLAQPALSSLLTVLRSTVRHQQELVIRGLLEILERLGNDPVAERFAQTLSNLAAVTLPDVLADPEDHWSDRLAPKIWQQLNTPGGSACAIDLPASDIADDLAHLVGEVEMPPTAQAVALFGLARIDRPRAVSLARDWLAAPDPIVADTAQRVVNADPDRPLLLVDCPTLEKLAALANTDFFADLNGQLLLEVAARSEVRSYRAGAEIVEAGDTCRELLVLIEGDAQITRPGDPAPTAFHPGQVLDELEVLAHSEQTGTVVALSEPTRILAMPVDRFDDLLDHDRELSRRVLELESRRLQQVLSLRSGLAPVGVAG